MRDFAILTLSRFPKIFNNLKDSVYKLDKFPKERILVTSGEAFKRYYSGVYTGWKSKEGKEPFNFSRNANLGLSALLGMDILLANDDVTFTNAITPVIDIVEANPDIGIVSPQVIGGIGNPYQSTRYKIIDDFLILKQRLAFVCVYIRKEVIEKIGLFDEKTFSDDDKLTYGSEDDDYCARALQEGFNLAVTPKMVVKHGFEQYEYSSSFLQVMTPEERNLSLFKMRQRFIEKYD